MASIPPDYRAAFQRWGYLADAEARKWGLPNGATLLAKIGYIESRYSRDLGITSYAGARGPMQFMPTTRDEYIKRYGVDPWKSVDEAVHAAALFMKSAGLDSYNPGSSTYINEVLKAPIGKVPKGSPGAARSPAKQHAGAEAIAAAAGDSDAEVGNTLLRFLLSAVLALGGFALMALGLTRAVGANPLDAAGRRLQAAEP